MAFPAAFRTIYRIFTWSSLVLLVLTLVLILKSPAGPNMAPDPTAAARLEQKFAEADQARASGQAVDVDLDRTELNSYLHQNLQLEGVQPEAIPASTPGNRPQQPSSPAETPGDPATLEQVRSSVKDVNVDMDGDVVRAYVTFDFHGKDLALELDGHVGTADGYLTFDPVAGKLGSLPLPQSTLQTAVDKMMASPENHEKLRLPPDISNISVSNGQAVISYK
ncbi:MAG TPA: hypothetical protein VI216_08390 [Candidatus Acidoferrales bacterium]